MRRVPLVQFGQGSTDEEYPVNHLNDFFIDKTSVLCLRYNEPTADHKFGTVCMSFIFGNKMDDDDVLYIHTLFELENKQEVEYIEKHPMNLRSFDTNTYENMFIPLISKMKEGVNSFNTNFVFSRPSDRKDDKYYIFDCVYSDIKTKTDTFRKAYCSKGTYLQLSQFLYWFLADLPLAPDIFTIDDYNRASFVSVAGMTFDGSTNTAFNNTKVTMGHFTLYTNNLTGNNKFGFNVPVFPLKRIERKNIDPKTYVALYSADDTIMPDRTFILSSPDKLFALLTGDKNTRLFTVYTMTKEVADRIKWLKWDEYIYYIDEERKVKE